jgi:hypothetical protein
VVTEQVEKKTSVRYAPAYIISFLAVVYYSISKFNCEYVHGLEILYDYLWRSLSIRAMAQVVSRRLLTSESRVWALVNPCGICGGQSGTVTGFSPSCSLLTCQYHSTVVLHTHISSWGWKICLLVSVVQRRSVTHQNQSINQSIKESLRHKIYKTEKRVIFSCTSIPKYSKLVLVSLPSTVLICISRIW